MLPVRLILLRSLCLLLAALGALSSTAFGQPAAGLFQHLSDVREVTNPRALERITRARGLPFAAEVQTVRIPSAPGLRERGVLLLNLGPGRQFLVRRSRVDVRGAESFSWFGASDGASPFVRALLVVNGENVTGNFQTAEGGYTIQPVGSGLHVITKLDPRKTPDCIGTLELPSRIVEELRPNFNLNGSSETAANITVLVLYTAEVASLSGDVNSLIQSAIDATNQTLGNTVLTHTVSRVY
jgi:hypothetical protein